MRTVVSRWFALLGAASSPSLSDGAAPPGVLAGAGAGLGAAGAAGCGPTTTGGATMTGAAAAGAAGAAGAVAEPELLPEPAPGPLPFDGAGAAEESSATPESLPSLISSVPDGSGLPVRTPGVSIFAPPEPVLPVELPLPVEVEPDEPPVESLPEVEPEPLPEPDPPPAPDPEPEPEPPPEPPPTQSRMPPNSPPPLPESLSSPLPLLPSAGSLLAVPDGFSTFAPGVFAAGSSPVVFGCAGRFGRGGVAAIRVRPGGRGGDHADRGGDHDGGFESLGEVRRSRHEHPFHHLRTRVGKNTVRVRTAGNRSRRGRAGWQSTL
ncbi:hypothetical protein [Tsukamurella sp. PLM1]|uniref:hypothetical protein n=1 Tax=Tsukamurella sp. PLM1 TaxID=2929795 RepID=UPI0020582CD4|nr:hypothetical protein [Tsukamurella sp. PLM1]BDH55170.1 hypothetical protein MTP03_01090 [Tsukamurella sp. PLM1]